MKIAIMTQPLGKNYGGIMQAWALQQVLKRMGHEVVTIDRQSDQPSLAYKAARLAYRAGMKAIGKRKAPINFEKYLPTILQHTQGFIDQHLTMSEPLYSTQQLRAHFDRENYDAVIVGSDQTWRPQYSPNIYNFFLDFLEDRNDILRIAYASSFGVDQWEYSEEQTRRCAELAKKFDAISVREDSGVELCRKYLGVEATHVLDPTLLLEKDEYTGLLDDRLSNSEVAGLYSYILDRSNEKNELLKTAEKSLNAIVFNSQPEMDFYGWTVSDLSKYVMPSPKGWVEGFNNGGYVITDSFHGTAFSIIFKKPFIALANKKRGESRFRSVLSKLDLKDRLIPPEKFSQQLGNEKSINWKRVDEKLKKLQAESLLVLQKVL